MTGLEALREAMPKGAPGPGYLNQLFAWLARRMEWRPDLETQNRLEHWRSVVPALDQLLRAKSHAIILDDCDGYAVTGADLAIVAGFPREQLEVACVRTEDCPPGHDYDHAISWWTDPDTGDRHVMDSNNPQGTYTLGSAFAPRYTPVLVQAFPLRPDGWKRFNSAQ